MPHALFQISNEWIQNITRVHAPETITVDFFHPDDTDLPDKLAKVDFLVTLRVDTAWVTHLKQCRLVQQQGVGYDAVDCEALHKAGIPLAITPQGTPESVAEHTMMLILSLYRNTVPIQADMRTGEFGQFAWRERSDFAFGDTLGIIGLGRIGKRVAHLAHVFGLRVIYTDLVSAPDDISTRYELERVDLDTLLTQSDIITVHTPLTELTRGFIGRAQFQKMKPDAIFINTSRGGTYDMDALADIMAEGHLRGAGLDVWNPEPPLPNHPIFALDNVIATPHMASGGVKTQNLKAQSQFANMLRVLNDETPHNLVPYTSE
ncbi:MAG: NAD(P)-dependent oxidoreductase [Chloroflexota bacterium]